MSADSDRTRQRLADTIREAAGGLASRPGRTILLCLGAAIGTAVLAVSMTLAAAASAQVTAQFNELRSTRITVTNPNDADWLKQRNLDRLRHLDGVVAAGTMRHSSGPVSVSRLGDGHSTSIPAAVTAAGPAALRAAGATVEAGRIYDAGAAHRGDQVVVLGAGLAQSLDLASFDGHTEIFIGGTRALVIGVVGSNADADPNLLLGAYLPSTRSLATAPIRWQAPSVVINTELAATNGLTLSAPVALAPAAVGDLVVQTPPDPQGLQSAVSRQLQLLLLVLGGISLAIGMIVIATATLSAVAQRRTEIALRRALGTSRGAIYLQILTETCLTGAIGGIVGVYLGELTTIIVSLANGWPVVTSLALIPAGAVVGIVAGSLAGVYPATNAATTEPAQALHA